MSAEAAEMPVKPSTPATIETSKKISAHFRIVIASSEIVPPAVVLRPFLANANFVAGNWFLAVSGTRGRPKRPLLNPVPGGKVRAGPKRDRGGHDDDVTFSDDRGRGARGAEGQGAQSVARSRPHLPDAGGAAAPRRHSLHLFRAHRSDVLGRFRRGRAGHRQLLHGDVLLSVGTVHLARHRAEGAVRLSPRSPVAARAAVRDRGVHRYPPRLLR